MPPLTDVAVKVTELPEQIEVELAAILTDGVTVVVTIVIKLLVAVTGLAQGSLEAMITVTTSLLLSVVVVNVEPVSPVTSIPLTCHW